jgi:CheY-like chemotaxis protein
MTASILVIEDEPDGQEVVAGILAHFNVDSEVVSSGKEALNLLSQRAYAAVILDLALPDIDGISLLRSIRANPQITDLPCLVMTAYHSSAVKKEALDAGCNSYMSKPLNEVQLIQELNRIIDNH